jgi:hypothetical protein
MSKSGKGEEIFESTPHSDSGSSSSESSLNNFKSNLLENPRQENTSLLTSSINPEEAFEIFNGKLFGVARTEYSVADAIERRVESPLQRYSRLRQELDTLTIDLESLAEAGKLNPDTSSFWSVLQSETNALVSSARSLENHKALQLLKKNISSSEKILDQLVASVKSISTRENPFKTQDNSNKVSLTTDMTVMSLEKRVTILETLLGIACNEQQLNLAGSKPFSSSFPLVEAIAKLEQRMSMLDSSNLDALRVKANTLRGELESAAKLKSPLTVENKALEAFKKVEDLVDKVHKIESVADDLPVLVVRLKTLENIHLAASTFADRLYNMEGEVSNLAADVKSNNEVLRALKVGMAENITIMQNNLKEMEHQFTAKQASSGKLTQ